MEMSNLDKLRESVTKNIFDKLDIKPQFIVSDKSCLILVPNTGLGFNDYYNYITKNYPGYDFFLGSNEGFSKTNNVLNNTGFNYINYDIKNSEFINLLDAVETIIILGLKINQMKSLVNTDDSEDINHIILESIMANKSVNILINANGLIFNKIVKTVKDIRSIGINVVNIQQSSLNSISSNELITESYVLNLRENGLKSIMLNKKQVITPLAKDKLRELKIKVEYNKEAK